MECFDFHRIIFCQSPKRNKMVITNPEIKGRNHNEDLNMYRPMEIRCAPTPERMRTTTITKTVEIVSAIGTITVVLMPRMEGTLDCMRANRT